MFALLSAPQAEVPASAPSPQAVNSRRVIGHPLQCLIFAVLKSSGRLSRGLFFKRLLHDRNNLNRGFQHSSSALSSRSHGARYGSVSIAFASLSSSTAFFAQSQRSERPRRSDRFAK